jgi:hypothetical protein
MFEDLGIGFWIFYIGSLLIFFVLGYFRGVQSLINLVVNEANKQDILAEGLIIDMTIEKVDGYYFAYAPDSEFLAQGKDFKDLINNIKSRFPDRKFKLAKFDAQWTDEETQKFVTALKEYLQGKQQ